MQNGGGQDCDRPDRDGALGLVLAEVRAGRDALITGDGAAGQAVLQAAAAALADECRVVTVAAGPGGLGLSGLMAQVAGEPDLTAQDDAVLERGFRRLAVPDAPGQRIVLLVSDAELLQRASLRYLQHVARTAPALLLVLQGGSTLASVLAGSEVAALEARLAAGAAIALAPPAPQEAAAPETAAPETAAPETAAPETAPEAAGPTPPLPRERVSSVSQRPRRRPIWAAAGIGMAASVAAAVWLGRQPPAPLPRPVPVAAAVPVVEAAPVAPARQAAPAATVPQPAPPREATVVAPAPVESAPPPVAASAEPEPAPPSRPARPRHAEARPREPQHPDSQRSDSQRPDSQRPDTQRPEIPRPVRQARAARPSSRSYAAEPDDGWNDAAPGPIYGGPPRGYWGRPAYDAPSADAPGGPYIGTYTADRDGMRTFHYGR